MAATTLAFEAEIAPGLAEPINSILNPSFENGLAGWTPQLSAGVLDTYYAIEEGWADTGRSSLRLKARNGTTGTARFLYMHACEGSARKAITPSSQVTAQAVANLLLAGQATNVFGVRIGMVWYKADGTASSPTNSLSTTYVTALGVAPVAFTATAPADATFAALRLALYFNTTAPTDAVLDAYVDSVAFYNGAGGRAYFDGNTPGNGWAGDGNYSASGAPTGFKQPARGLMAGAAYKLRQNYLAGMVDPAAHTNAKNHPKQLKALTDNSKLVSFDAITAP